MVGQAGVAMPMPAQGGNPLQYEAQSWRSLLFWRWRGAASRDNRNNNGIIVPLLWLRGI